jgi:Sec-independent protein secretion pathway component TatC
VGIVVVALVITPGADPFTPTALAIPLLLLYEASIIVLQRIFRR